MPNLRRVGVVFAVSTFAALALAAPAAMATPDPATCADGLFQLVKLRSSQDNLTRTVTVAEQDDAIAQKQLRDVQQADKDAKAKRGYLAEVKVDLNRNHDEVVRVTVLVNGLCGTPVPPAGFRSCADANAAGVFDIPSSDPRYRKDLDSDGDDVACEPPATPAPGQPPAVIQNNQIGQVPAGVPSGGGSMADTAG